MKHRFDIVQHLRIPSVRTLVGSENGPTPTAFTAAKRTEYDVYCLSGVIAKGSTKQTQKGTTSAHVHF